jgi:hypothetical protein
MLDKLVRGRIANFRLEVGAETLSDGVGAMTIREDAQAAAVVARDCAARGESRRPSVRIATEVVTFDFKAGNRLANFGGAEQMSQRSR